MSQVFLFFVVVVFFFFFFFLLPQVCNNNISVKNFTQGNILHCWSIFDGDGIYNSGTV